MPISFCQNARLDNGLDDVVANAAYQVPLPPGMDMGRAAQVVAAVCAAAGLRLTLHGTLAKYPGSVHWHFKQADQPGTLEITLWPAAHRLWFASRAGRTAPWVAALLPTLQSTLAQAISGLSSE